ncbi:organic solute transporter Ostalpha-domain-containing protein [Kockovaella imperatae]|uniref:Organic solute transporter Ostalpha-domain-containing protein n=1 Tax=Kockovaella imperatae TaxID=4999 RepID=A0A1Y1UAJ5_9TREE|nr:organic solute transporter Ostalpha-domain-containing protein [Kockovaella imperatae]ORX35039.1 organic solute transporter Ostalpha-domain-containing protein [Kockovaella imperatae]
MVTCPNVELAQADDCFFCPDGIHWDAHRIGWAVSGAAAAVTTLITLFTLTMHATHYQQPAPQRQIMRVLLMPAVYAIVSFFSYRYYQSYEYYVLAETAYEAVTLSAFLLLLMELVALRTSGNDIKDILQEKDKRKLPFPFNFLRFRASKPYFMHVLTFSVLQYVVIRPAITIAGIICLYYNVLCTGHYSVHFAAVYLDAIDFASISIALYGLIVFYVLCKDELKGRRPLAKFLAIKLIVFFVFYQGFIFTVLQHYNVIKATRFWTAENVSDGLSALCTTLEMVVFSAYMGWAYSWKEYTSPEMNPNQRPTNARTYFSAIWDTINLSDFAAEIWAALKFFVAFILGRPGTHSRQTKMQKTFMPHTMNPREKMPMESMDSTNRPFPGRTSSGNVISNVQSPSAAAASYQRLDVQSNSWRPSTDEASGLEPRHPFANPTPAPTIPASGSFSHAGPQRQSRAANPSATSGGFPQPHPYSQHQPSSAAASGLMPPVPSRNTAGFTPMSSTRSFHSVGGGSTVSGTSHYATPMGTPGEEFQNGSPWSRDGAPYSSDVRTQPMSTTASMGQPHYQRRY